jgi:hypothetical protein
MEQVLLLAEPCERFDGHCSHGEEKCDATMRDNGLQQVAQRQGWRRGGGERKNGLNAPLH